MGLSVSAAAVDINEPYEVAKKEKALSGDCSYAPRQAKRLRRAPTSRHRSLHFKRVRR